MCRMTSVDCRKCGSFVSTIGEEQLSNEVLVGFETKTNSRVQSETLKKQPIDRLPMISISQYKLSNLVSSLLTTLRNVLSRSDSPTTRLDLTR